MACKLTKQDVTNQLQKDIDDKVLDTTLFVKESNTHYKYEPTFLPQVRQQIAKINDFSVDYNIPIDIKLVSRNLDNEDGPISKWEYSEKIDGDVYNFQLTLNRYKTDNGFFEKYLDIDFDVNGTGDLINKGVFKRKKRVAEIVSQLIKKGNNYSYDWLRLDSSIDQGVEKAVQRANLYERILKELGFTVSNRSEDRTTLFITQTDYFNKLSEPIKSTDKIIWGHPGIGKTFLRQSNSNVIDFDSDYKSRINEKYNLPEGFKARNKWREDNKELWNKEIRQLWTEAKKESKETGKILLVSDILMLREFAEDFDKVINISKETFIDRAKQRNDYTEGNTEQWKSSIDEALKNIDSKLIYITDKYISDLIPNIELQNLLKNIDFKNELINNTLDTVSLIKNANIKFNNPDLQKLINQVPSYIEMFDTINKINMEIGQDVLFPEAAGKVYTEIPESLIDQYMITADSAEHFAEMIRRDYLDQFDDARNKVNLDEFISHPHINEPVKKDLIRFLLKINPNFRLAIVDDLNQDGVVLIADSLVLLRSNNVFILAEETAHVYIGLLQDDSPLKQRLLEEVINHKEYQDIVQKYGLLPEYQFEDGSINYGKIKLEAAGKLVANYINSLNKESYGKRRSTLQQIIDSILKYLRELININYPIYEESIFQDIANSILRQDLSEINPNKELSVEESLYYSVTNNMPEGYETDKHVRQGYSTFKKLQSNFLETSKLAAIIRGLPNIAKYIEDTPFSSNFNYQKIQIILDLLNKNDVTISKNVDIFTLQRTIGDVIINVTELPNALEKAITEIDDESDIYTGLKIASAYNKIAELYIEQFTKLNDFLEENKSLFDTTEEDIDTRNSLVAKISVARDKFIHIGNRLNKKNIDNLHTFLVSNTSEGMATMRAYIQEMVDNASTDEVKARHKAKLLETVSSPEQLLAILTGRFKTKDENDNPINYSKIADITSLQNATAWFSSPGETGDLVLGSLMEYYKENLNQARLNSLQEQLEVSNELEPLLQAAVNAGNYYQKQAMLIDKVDIGNGKQRAILITEDDRFRGNKKKEEFQKRIQDAETDEEKDKIRKERDEFIAKNFYRKYKDSFYEITDEVPSLLSNKESNKKIKELKNKIFYTMEYFYINNPLNISFLESGYSEEIRSYQKELYELKKDLSVEDQEKIDKYFKEYQTLFEDDIDKTAQVKLAHKHSWMESNRERYRRYPQYQAADAKLEELLESTYAGLFEKRVMGDEAKKELDELYSYIDKIELSEYYESIFKENSNEIRKILSSRRTHLGDIFINSFIYDDVEINEKLRDLLSKQEQWRQYKSIVQTFDISDRLLNLGAGLASDLDKGIDSIYLDILFTKDQIKSFRDFIKNNNIANDMSSDVPTTVTEAKDKMYGFIMTLLTNNKGNTLFDPLTDTKYTLDDELLSFFQEIFNNTSTYIKTYDDQVFNVLNQKNKKKTDLFRQIDKLRTYDMSYDYRSQVIFPLTEILLKFSDLQETDKLLEELDTTTVLSDMQLLLGSNEFQSLLNQASNTIDTLPDSKEKENYRNFITFFDTWHTIKNRGFGKDNILEINKFFLVPVARKQSLNKIQSPSFLNRRKVKEEHVTPLRNDIHPDVLAGNASPTIDMLGNYLPRLAKDGGSDTFKSTKYEEIKKDPALFEYYKKWKELYFKQQEKVDAKMDVLIPAKNLDSYEQKANVLTTMKSVKERIVDAFANKDSELEQELGTKTANEVGLYDEVDAEYDDVDSVYYRKNYVKLSSKRFISANKQSNDLFGALLSFVNDTNKYRANEMSRPMFEVMHSTLTQTQKNNPKINKKRAQLIKDITEFFIYSNAPEGDLNNKYVAGLAKYLNKTGALALGMFDIIGAPVNWIGGQTQMLIRSAGNVDRIKSYSKAKVNTPQYMFAYNKDLSGTSKLLTKEVLFMISIGGFTDEFLLSEKTSPFAKWSSYTSTVMIPRSQSEISMQISMALQLTYEMGKIANNKGELFDLANIYEQKDNELILKPGFDPVKYDIKTGTEILKLRSTIWSENTRTQGNYGKESPALVQMYEVGKVYLFMKKYFFPLMQNVYGFERINILTNEINSGYLNTLFKLVASKDFFKAMKDAVVLDYWKSIVKTKHHKKNLAKLGIHGLLLMMFHLILTKVLGFDDDDKNRFKKMKKLSKEQQIAMVIIYKSFSELGTMIPLPWGGLGFKEYANTAFSPFKSALNTVNRSAKIIQLSGYALADQLGADYSKQLIYDKDGGYWFREKGDSKLAAEIIKLMGVSGARDVPFTDLQGRPDTYLKQLLLFTN